MGTTHSLDNDQICAMKGIATHILYSECPFEDESRCEERRNKARQIIEAADHLRSMRDASCDVEVSLREWYRELLTTPQ